MNEMFWTQLFDLHYHRPIKLIKVGPEAFNYIEAQCKPDMTYQISDDTNGYIGEFTGVPIAVDDTLSGYEYQLVFSKEK